MKDAGCCDVPLDLKWEDPDPGPIKSNEHMNPSWSCEDFSTSSITVHEQGSSNKTLKGPQSLREQDRRNQKVDFHSFWVMSGQVGHPFSMFFLTLLRLVNSSNLPPSTEETVSSRGSVEICQASWPWQLSWKMKNLRSEMSWKWQMFFGLKNSCKLSTILGSDDTG